MLAKKFYCFGSCAGCSAGASDFSGIGCSDAVSSGTNGFPKFSQPFVAHVFFPVLNSSSITEPLQLPLHTYLTML